VVGNFTVTRACTQTKENFRSYFKNRLHLDDTHSFRRVRYLIPISPVYLSQVYTSQITPERIFCSAGLVSESWARAKST